MTFRDDVQRGEVCFVLTAWVRGEPWKHDGIGYRPGKEPDGLSTGEAMMVAFARAIWAGDDLIVWTGFDSRRMRDIAELLVAMVSGEPGNIEWWIAHRSNPEGFQSREAWEADVRRRARV